MALNVLMVGGPRCGKTSALASIFSQLINGPINRIFTLSDQTIYETKVNLDGIMETQETLNQKDLELQGFLETPNNNTFLVDSGRTRCDWTYRLRLTIPGTNRSMDMEFLDCPGEFFQQGLHDQQTRQFVGNSDVYVVTIDTPYIMQNNDAIATGVNCIRDIHNFFTHINCINGKTAKMVLFVPIKCEYWARNGQMNQVNQRIKQLYRTIIQALCAYANMTVAILPIQTAGNIEFVEMQDAYIRVNGNQKEKCAILNNRWIRLANGQVNQRQNGDIFNRDPECVIAGIGTRPYSWYQISQNPQMAANGNGLYNPYNCEQLPLHILNFWFKKTMVGVHGGFWGWLTNIFGGISQADMNNCMAQLNQRGLIRNNVDGIEYLHQAQFRP